MYTIRDWRLNKENVIRGSESEYLYHIKHTKMEASSTTMALLRNFLITFFILADKSLGFLAEKSKLLEALRLILISSFLFFLRLLPSLFPSLNFSVENYSYPSKPRKGDNSVSANVVGGSVTGSGGVPGSDSGIGRALLQLLSIANNIPVSSRKYDLARSLAEKLIDENLSERNEALREINCNALSAAFDRTLSQLEAFMVDKDRSHGLGVGNGDGIIGNSRDGDYYNSFSRFTKALTYYGGRVWQRGKSKEELSRSGSSAEKLAAELLWLTQKMAACECPDEAVNKWASASSLAWLSLTTEPRLQGSIVKISAFLFKQARNLGNERREEVTKEQQRQTKVKMLLLWIPLLCRASTGTDSPVLSVNERAELERILEEIIEALEHLEDQEKVLSLWLHHFTHCPSSDWPNLYGCYIRWCTASRRHFLKTK